MKRYAILMILAAIITVQGMDKKKSRNNVRRLKQNKENTRSVPFNDTEYVAECMKDLQILLLIEGMKLENDPEYQKFIAEDQKRLYIIDSPRKLEEKK